MVLLHGGGQTRHSWFGALQVLAAKGYRVATYDARGHGESEWSEQGRYSLVDRVEDLRAVLAIGAQPFALVGASLGGATALLGAASGIKPAGLVMVDIVPEPEPEGIARIIEFMSAHPEGFGSLQEAAAAVAAYNPARPRPADPMGLKRNLRQREDGRLHWHWDPLILKLGPEEHHAAVLRAAQNVGKHASCPVMLVRGSHSDVVSDRGVQKFKALIPALQIAEVGGAGHMVAGDRNDSFNSAVLDFLDYCLPLKEAV